MQKYECGRAVIGLGTAAVFFGARRYGSRLWL
jgi:hypothetical protein